jgi:hypothetical protein
VPPIRILLVDLPRALDDVVRGWLSREEDMAVVVEAADADVHLIAAAEADQARACAELLGRDPRLRVVALDPESGRASTWRLEPRSTDLGVLPLTRLSDAVRSAMRPTRVD